MLNRGVMTDPAQVADSKSKDASYMKFSQWVSYGSLKWYVCSHFLISQVGLRAVANSFRVPTWSVGTRLSRKAPFRTAFWCAADKPDRLLRMLPASLPASLFLKRGGGAKSSEVKVPDFLNA